MTLTETLSVETRGEALEIVDAGLRWLSDKVTVDQSGRRLCVDYERLRSTYAELVEDHDLADESNDALDALGARSLDDAPADTVNAARAHELARSGRLEEALACVAATNHPWRAAFERAHLKAVAHKLEEALDDALELERRFPRRAPVSHMIAKLLVANSRYLEALPYARAAFGQFPAIGHRMICARILVFLEKANDALVLLRPVAGHRKPRLLKLLAQASEPSDPRAALALWTEYTFVRGADHVAALKVAQLLFALGQFAEAAQRAWSLFERAHDVLDARTIYQCALYQRLDKFTSIERGRVERASGELAQRFRGNAEAEQYRMQLNASLGFPSNEPPIDYAVLEASGFVRSVSVEELVRDAVSRRDSRATVLDLYARGQLPFESMCEFAHVAAATFVATATTVANRRDGQLIQTPLSVTDGPLRIFGRRVLVGELELLLLHELKLLHLLRTALGDAGRLIVFQDVWQRMALAAGELEASAQRVALENEEKLLQLLQEHGKVTLHEERSFPSDAAWARERMAPYVDVEPPSSGEHLSAGALVRHMIDSGHLDRSESDAILRALATRLRPADC